MMLLHEDIKPYVGTDTFALGDTLENVREKLKTSRIKFNQGIDPNKGCKPEIPWIFIEIENCITLCFAMDVLFEIVFENGYAGKLPNGGCVGMKMDDMEKLDDSLQYNDEDEDFISENGYWIGDDCETETISSITIFLPEVENVDFFEYKWIDKYKVNEDR